MVVVLKPAGWETDVYDVSRYGVPITPVAREYLLSTFMGDLFSKEEHPVCHSPSDGFGFIHRLDQMSSGLILAATRYESLLFLQLQMCCYDIARQYFVLCHGPVRPSAEVLQMRGRILEGERSTRCTQGGRSRVDARGKPAESRALPAAHLQLQAEGAFTAVVISIVTGRQHQIRAHLQHIGHPSVYDGRYVLPQIFLRGGAADGGLRFGDAARVSEDIPQPRPLPAWFQAELRLRGANTVQ